MGVEGRVSSGDPPPRPYTLELKQDAVRFVKEQGLTPAPVARDPGLDRSIVRAWVEKADAGQLLDAPVRPPSAPSLEEENHRRRKQNAVLREEREVLERRSLLREGDPVTAYRFIDAENARHTLRMICRVIGVSRPAYHVRRAAQMVANADADALVRAHIRGAHRACRPRVVRRAAAQEEGPSST